MREGILASLAELERMKPKPPHPAARPPRQPAGRGARAAAGAAQRQASRDRRFLEEFRRRRLAELQAQLAQRRAAYSEIDPLVLDSTRDPRARARVAAYSRPCAARRASCRPSTSAPAASPTARTSSRSRPRRPRRWPSCSGPPTRRTRPTSTRADALRGLRSTRPCSTGSSGAHRARHRARGLQVPLRGDSARRRCRGGRRAPTCRCPRGGDHRRRAAGDPAAAVGRSLLAGQLLEPWQIERATGVKLLGRLRL